MRPAWLTPDEAAGLSRQPRHRLLRALRSGRIPTLALNARTIRVPADAIQDGAPSRLPARACTMQQLAELLRAPLSAVRTWAEREDLIEPVAPTDLDDALRASLSDNLTTARYLLPQEAAQLLGVSRRTVLRRIDTEELPALRLGERLHRIEAQAIRPGAPTPHPIQGPLTAMELAELWRVSPATVHSFMGAAGPYPLTVVIRAINDATTGPDLA